MIGDASAEMDDSVPSDSPADLFSPKLITQTLDALAASIFQDSDFVGGLLETPRVMLRQNTPSGGKFWMGAVTPHGVALHWGKIGTRGSIKFIQLDQCEKSNPAVELKARVLSKLCKGYQLVPQQTFLP